MKLQSPKGEIFEVKNIREFARENDLDHSALIRLNNGKVRHYKHWIVPKRRIKLYSVVSPEGKVFKDILVLKEFCEENKLNYRCVHSVCMGKKKQWRGWRKGT